MSANWNRPPAGEPWVPVTLKLLTGEGCRKLGVNDYRLITYLLLEHMGKGGQHNGHLKAPRRQLRAFGIGSHQISPTIQRVEEAGFIRVHRGGMRVATTYTLSWIPPREGGKAHRMAAGERWTWLTRELLASDAWRSLGVNEFKLIVFLLIQHMKHAGKQNGKLLAPYRLLEEFGVCRRRLAATIRNLEALGLIDCFRGGMRVATNYALTWLPMHDGTPPSNRWRDDRNPNLKRLPQPSAQTPEGLAT